MRNTRLSLQCLFSFCLILVFLLVWQGCATEKKECCAGKGQSTLFFSQLPAGPLPAVFTVDKVTAIRIYGGVQQKGGSLWLQGQEEVPPGSGNKKNAAVMLLFSQLSCQVCAITADVNGHGSEARLVAAQQNGTTQTALCDGGKQLLTLYATRQNPFVWVILSGQNAQWLHVQVQ